MNKKQFVSFITAGDPSIEATRKFIDVLAEYSDIIEIGLPFSDPIADGDVIRDAGSRALANGTTTDKVFAMLKTVDFPRIVIMTHLNPVFVYGVDKFFAECKNCGVYGIIIPDLPYEERGEVSSYAVKYGIHLITLIAPTSEDRIKMLARDASGFIYLVSSMGVTGVRSEFTIDLEKIVKQIRGVSKIPVMIGFGISTPAHAEQMRKIADGIIVGSAIVKIIEQHKENASEYIRTFLKEMNDC